MLTWSVVLAVVVAVAVAAIGGGLWVYAWAKLGGADVPVLAAEGDEALGAGGATAPEGTSTALVALTGEVPDDGSSGAPLAGPVALVQTGGARGDDAAVLLLPRELRVTVEGEEPMALGDVHAAGGVDLLARTVVDYTQVAVDHVVTADVDALPALVEALGPVEVCTAACRVVDADEARTQLAAVTASDVPPAEAGAALGELAALLGELSDRTDLVRVLTSPVGTKRGIDVLADHVTTDVDLRGAAALAVADRLAGLGEVAVVTLPGVVNPDSGQLVVLPEQAATRFALLREGGLPEASADEDEAAVLASATVAVLNGTGTDGFAGALEAELVGAGVTVVGTENASNFDFERTVVQYGPDDPAAEAAAVLLAAELGADVELQPSDRELTFEGEPVTLVVIGGADLDDGEGD